jgi:hypothetical protein
MKYILSPIINYQHVSIAFPIIIRVVLQVHYEYNVGRVAQSV